MQNPAAMFGVQAPMQAPMQQPMQQQAVAQAAPVFNVSMPPPHDPYSFNIMANPSGNRQLDDMERAYKLR